jgi:hypothetical protein
MKEDKLEKYMKENREQFDLHSPDPEIWDRIRPSIQKSVIKKVNWKTVTWRVAAAGIIFILTVFASEYYFNKNAPLSKLKFTGNKEVSIPELDEAEIYYTAQLQSKYMEAKEYLTEHPELEIELIRDLNALDSIRNELKKDLKDNIANKEVVEALIQNYRMKLTILEDLLYQLEYTEGLNDNENNDHEL